MPRTKGSKNGVSHTKGYTAVGQKAKGRLVNGKYVYDDPSMMLGTTQMYNHANWQQAANATRAEQEQYNRWYGKGAQKIRGIAKPGLDPDLSNGARYDPNLISTISKGFNSTSTSPAYDATKRKAENDAMRAKITSLASVGASRGDAQQASLEQWKKQNQNAIATNKKFQKAYKDSLAKGAAMGDAAKAADAQRKAEAKARWNAGNNAQAAKKSAEQGAKNNWQQQANAKRDDVETYRKYKQGSINGIARGTTVMQRPKDELEPTRWTEVKPMTKTASGAKGKLNNWQNQAAKAATGGTVPTSYNWKKYNSLKIKAENRQKRAAENAKKSGKANNWQQNAAKASAAGIRNNAVNDTAAANKKKYYADTLAKGAAMGDAAKAADAQRKAEAKARWNAGNKAAANAQSIRDAVNKGSENDWQQAGNKERARVDYLNLITNDKISQKKASAKSNAMKNDPRYSTGYHEVKNKEGKVIGTYSHSVLNSTPNGRDKYDYSGKSDSRAPTFKGFEGTFKMNRDPYFNSWANASNAQEEAKAISKNKEFMNDFRTSKIRNSRSDIGNALADAKEEAKAKWKSLKKSIKKKKK